MKKISIILSLALSCLSAAAQNYSEWAADPSSIGISDQALLPNGTNIVQCDSFLICDDESLTLTGAVTAFIAEDWSMDGMECSVELRVNYKKGNDRHPEWDLNKPFIKEDIIGLLANGEVHFVLEDKGYLTQDSRVKIQDGKIWLVGSFTFDQNELMDFFKSSKPDRLSYTQGWLKDGDIVMIVPISSRSFALPIINSLIQVLDLMQEKRGL